MRSGRSTPRSQPLSPGPLFPFQSPQGLQSPSRSPAHRLTPQRAHPPPRPCLPGVGGAGGGAQPEGQPGRRRAGWALWAPGPLPSSPVLSAPPPSALEPQPQAPGPARTPGPGIPPGNEGSASGPRPGPQGSSCPCQGPCTADVGWSHGRGSFTEVASGPSASTGPAGPDPGGPRGGPRYRSIAQGLVHGLIWPSLRCPLARPLQVTVHGPGLATTQSPPPPPSRAGRASPRC